jgi:hypothetical protein
MDMEDLRGLMRAMAWERAKGELESMLATFSGDKSRFDALDILVTEFVAEVEAGGLFE